MNESELRHQLLALYNILRNHIVVTSQIEEMVQALVERDPELKKKFENAQREEHEAAARNAELPLPNTDDLLLRVQQTIRQLGVQNRQPPDQKQ